MGFTGDFIHLQHSPPLKRIFHHHSSFQWTELFPWSSFLILFSDLSSYVVFHSEPENAIKFNLFFFITGKGLPSTSSLVTKFQLSDLFVKLLLMHSNFVSNPRLTLSEDLSRLTSSIVVVHVSYSRGCKDLSYYIQKCWVLMKITVFQKKGSRINMIKIPNLHNL